MNVSVLYEYVGSEAPSVSVSATRMKVPMLQKRMCLYRRQECFRNGGEKCQYRRDEDGNYYGKVRVGKGVNSHRN